MKKIIFSVICVVFTLTAAPVFADDPETPTGLDLDAGSTYINVSWDVNTDDIDGYYVRWQATSGTGYTSGESYENQAKITSASAYEYTITGLTVNTTYRVELTAYTGDTESDTTSDSITTSELEITVELYDTGTIEVYLDGGGDSGFETYDVYYRSESDSDYPDSEYATSVDSDDSTIISNLDTGTTYYVKVIAYYDSSDPDNSASAEASIMIEDFNTLLNQSDSVDDGCFIQSATGPSPALLLLLVPVMVLLLFGKKPTRGLFSFMGIIIFLGVVIPSPGMAVEDVNYPNMAGFKIGVFFPSEDAQHDVYDSIVPYGLFYERMFGRYLSADIFGGYCHSKGYATTTSGAETAVRTTLDMIPVSASVNVNIPFHPLFSVYAGAGGDYWYFKEEFQGESNDHHVGGWHGKFGLKMFTGDRDYYKKGGVFIEAIYSKIDRFGSNDLDLGGWTYMAGVMYCF